jgi:hypothetical protein
VHHHPVPQGPRNTTQGPRVASALLILQEQQALAAAVPCVGVRGCNHRRRPPAPQLGSSAYTATMCGTISSEVHSLPDTVWHAKGFIPSRICQWSSPTLRVGRTHRAIARAMLQVFCSVF